MLACNYSIPWAGVKGRDGQTAAFHVARCRTWSGLRLDGFCWIRWAPVRARQGPVWSHMDLYINPLSIRISQVICQVPLGPLGHLGFRRLLVGTLIWHDGTRRGSTDRSTGPYRFTIDVRTPWARHGVTTGPRGSRRDPTGPRRTPGGTVGPRFVGASLV